MSFSIKRIRIEHDYMDRRTDKHANKAISTCITHPPSKKGIKTKKRNVSVNSFNSHMVYEFGAFLFKVYVCSNFFARN